MKVIVSRSGGTAGIRLTWEVRVDEQSDALSWADFLSSLPWNDVTDDEPPPHLADFADRDALADRSARVDRYVYRIRCAPHEVVLAEPEVNGPWRDLIDRVQAANGRY